MKISMFGIKGFPVPGGAESVVEQIGSRLVARGHDVTVYVRTNFIQPGLTEYKGMHLVHLPSAHTKNLDTITHGFLASLCVLMTRPDIVHIHSTGSSVFALLPRLLGLKTVVQSHGLDWQRAKWGAFAKFYLHLTDYSTVHFPNATTAVSLKLVNYYQSLTKRPIYHIPNGVSTGEWNAPNLIRQYGLQGRDYILFASRFVPEKGIQHLIDAFNSLDTDKKLVLAGDDNYGSLYAKQIKGQASERIICPGFVSGALLQEFLSNAYLYVLPSEIEGLSTGLLEAMGYGNCVLVSDIEENLEVIGSAGLSFQSRSTTDLATKLGLQYSSMTRYLQPGALVSAYKADEFAIRLRNAPYAYLGNGFL